MPRRLLLAIVVIACACLPAAAQNVAPYSFQQAVRQGVVDFVVNPWLGANAAHYDALLSALASLRPGLVNRLGFEYGGVSVKKLDFASQYAARIHALLPQARIGGGFPENLKDDYAETLPCDSESDLRLFSRPDLTSRSSATGGRYFWIDISLPAAQDYYICIGKAEIRRGFAHFHFEESNNVAEHSISKHGAIAGYRRIREALISYAKARGLELSFSGEPELAHAMPLDAVYIPARFYIDGFATEYRNRIPTPVGRGYTYALSAAIADHCVAQVPRSTRVLFYIDNFDYHQDDLRRMMELDSLNRRELITRSAQTAHDHGVTFVAALNHCDGCVPASFVGDKCEITSSNVSYYNAATCGDIEAVRRALQIQH